ncbi:MAG: hypothetical protein RSB95_05020 [Bacilli bacterium]
MKNILVLIPNFHGYENDIANSIKYEGYNVKNFSCTIKLTFLDRLIKKITSKFVQRKFDNYFNKFICSHKHEKFDYVVLFFGGHYINEYHIDIMRKTFEDAFFIFYAWDSVELFPNIKKFYKMFDRYYSFDDYDCKKYGFKFLPLFYIEKNENTDIKYDVSTVMTFSYLKAKNYFNILSALPSNLNMFLFLRYEHRSTYIWNKLVHKDLLKNFKMSDFSFKGISTKESNNIYNSSKAVIECLLDGQHGLSIRAFETLSKNRKLITTNANIKNYPFYTPNNIFVCEKENEIIPISFFEDPFDLNYKISEEYSISNFLKKLLNDKND